MDSPSTTTGIPYLVEMDLTPFKVFSNEEQAYAISQLDPFHDQEYKLSGAPSDQHAKSIVITVNSETVVNAQTFGLSTAAGDKWDLHVASLPISQAVRAYDTYTIQSGGLSAGASSGAESPFKVLSPITASAAISGQSTFTDNTAGTPFIGLSPDITSFVSNVSSSIQVPRTMRVIAAAFEVVDESPTLYQQGACTVYSRNSNLSKDQLYSVVWTPRTATANVTRTLYTHSFSGPPTKVQYATIIPGSQTWKATEGAYVTSRKTVDTVPFTRPGVANILMYNPTDPELATRKNCYVGREALNLQYNPGDLENMNAFTIVGPFNVSGAYLTGLNSEFGTYRIRSKISYEIIPDPTDTTLISQATPTLPRNPVFEELLDRVLFRLPPGVQQTMNPKGEFWKMVKKVTGSALKTLSPAIGMYNPSLGIAANLVGNELDRTKKKKATTTIVRKK